MWFQIIKKFKKGEKKRIYRVYRGGKKSPNNKLNTRGACFRCITVIFKALSVGRCALYRRVYSQGEFPAWVNPRGRCSGPSGAEHPKSGHKAGSHSHDHCASLGIKKLQSSGNLSQQPWLHSLKCIDLAKMWKCIHPTLLSMDRRQCLSNTHKKKKKKEIIFWIKCIFFSL